ncbi:MAG: hypothetical protein P4L46_08600 [Fimbriimonas sp.]|nr:hypothetical protein [Fimbriimonas sp.]
MATNDPIVKKDFAEALQSVPKPVLYLVLFLFAGLPLFFPVKLPNKPIDASIDCFAQLMSLPEGSKVLIASDWTNSTRGESMGQMEALLRILMRKKIKFVVYTVADPQAPEVARFTIRKVAAEEAKAGGYGYKPFQDYLVLGYYPNAEGTTTAINNKFLSICEGKKDYPEDSPPMDVLRSPVLQGVKSVADFKDLVLVTASSTNTVVIERVTKVPLIFMVTGVMVPENTTYYASGQLKGLCGGVKGVYDLETLMEYGLNVDGPHKITSDKYSEVIPGFPGKQNEGKGTAYYPSLHFALFLLIIAVVAGNVGMILAKRRAG